MRFISTWLLKILGWKIVPLTTPIDKAVFIVAPHTSTWDIFIGLAISVLIEQKISWVAKKEIFVFPIDGLLRRLGGIPLDREHCKDTVTTMAEEFRKRDTFLFGLAPEGTRAKTNYWRSGFYHIACKANVPIVLAFLDYGKKEGGFGPILYPSGDVKADLKKMEEFYSQIRGKNHEKFSPIRFRELEEKPKR